MHVLNVLKISVTIIEKTGMFLGYMLFVGYCEFLTILGGLFNQSKYSVRNMPNSFNFFNS